jgi:hypothetical protein
MNADRQASVNRWQRGRGARLPVVLAVLLAAGLAALRARAEEPPLLAVKVDPDQLDFLIGTDLAGRYHKSADLARPYLWPLMGPERVPLTRGWPMEKPTPGGSSDHPHHQSAWFGYGVVIPEGIELKQHVRSALGVDFWSDAKGRGRIVCTEVGAPAIDPSHARLPTRNQWQSADGITILDESRALSLYPQSGAWLLVVDIDLVAPRCPITFGDTKEGAFAIRVNDHIRQQAGGTIRNAAGKAGESACWGQSAAWCDCSGTVDGKQVGIAILDDPANPYPACWHCRAYGLIAANPFGRARSGFPAMRGRTDVVKLAKGQHLRLRYGLLLHGGDADSGKVAEHFAKFVALRAEKPAAATPSTAPSRR